MLRRREVKSPAFPAQSRDDFTLGDDLGVRHEARN
jgi:hypothetical protein